MEIFLSPSFTKLTPPPLGISTAVANTKQLRARPVFCFGLESSGEVDEHNNALQSTTNNETNEKHNEIWRLFQEAQQNILYLNKQRVMALEELDRVKREKASLLDKIEQLEAETLLNSGKDKQSISSELLLRIDSMVLFGTIGSREASDLRRLVFESKMSVADNFFEIINKKDAELLIELRKFSEQSKKKGLHIIHICTEMAPVVSVGSLASYVTGISCALQRKGNVVEVILPKYSSLNLDEVQGFREVEAEFYSFFNGQLHANRIWTGFTYFSRASLDYIVKSGKQPDVLHLHNWETSIIGPLFWDIFVNQGLGGTRILLTCQGFDRQCLEQPEKLALCGLDPSKLNRPDRLQDDNKTHLVNILKGGIVYSNKVIVMSSMLTKSHVIGTFGNGLEPILDIHKDKLLIAPHAFDKSIWDPSVDKFLPQNYSAEEIMGKSMCKISLQQHLGLMKHASMILVGCVFSDVSKIDIENLKTLVWMASRQGVQFAFVMNRRFESFEEEFKDGNVRFVNKYDDALLHLLFAGCDIMLCPSFDNPVLQVPLKAIRYGTIPVAVDVGDSRLRQFVGRDFESIKVSQYIKDSFTSMSLSQAIDEIKNNPAMWNRRITDAMAEDFSWDAECSDIHISAYTALKNL